MKLPTLTRNAGRVLPLAALVAVGGCFATRNDVRVVQSDIASMRTELLRAHADEREQLNQAIRTLQVASDSVRVMSNRLTAIQGDVRGGLRSVTDQLGQVQELLKQSAQAIAQQRADLESKFNQPPASSGAVPPGMPDSTGALAAPQPATGAATLLATGNSNLNRNSLSTARAAFQELLTNYPTSDLAPQAQLGIGRSYEAEKQFPAALSAYGAVVSKYPQSSAAPNALYKSANIYLQQGRNAEAKAMLQTIISKYPASDEFDRANDLIKTVR